MNHSISQIQNQTPTRLFKVTNKVGIYLGLISLLLVSCAKTEKQIEYQYYSDPNTSKQEALFHASISPTKLPNTYDVKLDWNRDPNVEAYTITKSLGDRPVANQFVGPAIESLDPHQKGGDQIEYALKSVSKDGTELIAKIEVLIPSDIVVTGTVSSAWVTSQINKNTNRLFLTKGSVIRTDGAPFRLRLNNLFSENGRIETFDPNILPSLGEPGKSGGEIRLQFDKAEGQVDIDGRGTNGGNGVSGTNGSQGAKGLDSQSCLDSGGAGGTGFTGGAGTKGGAGGNSVYLEFRVDDASAEFQLVKNLDFGKGGLGGTGGIGGEGGPGGAGFHKEWDPHPRHDFKSGDFHIMCASTDAGPKGAKGAPGTDGEKGIDGVSQVPCIQIGQHTEGNCTK